MLRNIEKEKELLRAFDRGNRPSEVFIPDQFGGLICLSLYNYETAECQITMGYPDKTRRERALTRITESYFPDRLLRLGSDPDPVYDEESRVYSKLVAKLEKKTEREGGMYTTSDEEDMQQLAQLSSVKDKFRFVVKEVKMELVETHEPLVVRVCPVLAEVEICQDLESRVFQDDDNMIERNVNAYSYELVDLSIQSELRSVPKEISFLDEVTVDPDRESVFHLLVGPMKYKSSACFKKMIISTASDFREMECKIHVKSGNGPRSYWNLWCSMEMRRGDRHGLFSYITTATAGPPAIRDSTCFTTQYLLEIMVRGSSPVRLKIRFDYLHCFWSYIHRGRPRDERL